MQVEEHGPEKWPSNIPENKKIRCTSGNCNGVVLRYGPLSIPGKDTVKSGMKLEPLFV